MEESEVRVKYFAATLGLLSIAVLLYALLVVTP